MADLVQGRLTCPRTLKASPTPWDRHSVLHFLLLEVPTALAYNSSSYLVSAGLSPPIRSPQCLGCFLSPILHLHFEYLQGSGPHKKGGQATLSLSIPEPCGHVTRVATISVRSAFQWTATLKSWLLSTKQSCSSGMKQSGLLPGLCNAVALKKSYKRLWEICHNFERLLSNWL